jgi:hypothetical protein
MDIRSDHLRPTRDHVIPQSLGGKIKVWCCYVCNAVKRNMTPDQWAFYRDEHPEWWHKGSRAEKAMRWAAKRSPLEQIGNTVVEAQF